MTHSKTVMINSFLTLIRNSSNAQSSLAEFFSCRDFRNRKVALEEGYLIDVSNIANIFHVPVAITREVWALCISNNNPDLFNQQFRVVSLLAQTKAAIKTASSQASEVQFDVKQFPRKVASHHNKIRLWGVVSSGDNKKPVFTIMLDTQHGEILL